MQEKQEGFAEGTFYICKRDIKKIIFDNMKIIALDEIAIILNKEKYRTEKGCLWTYDNVNKFIVNENMT